MKEPELGSVGAVEPSLPPVRTVESDGPVLVAVDSSGDSEAALIWAVDHARRAKMPLQVLHVIHDPANAPGTYSPDNGDPLEPMVDVANRKLVAFLDDVSARHPETPLPDDLDASCISGLPAETILAAARDRGAGHLVLGCHGKNAAARLLFGSTSQRVAQKARIPVTIVKANGQ